MAVEVFKDGKSALIEPEHLQNHLAAGWSVEDPNAPRPPGLRILNPKGAGEPFVDLATSIPSFDAETGLFGSLELPAQVEIGRDFSLSLDQLVATAFAQSHLLSEQWNALPQDERDRLLKQALEAMRFEYQTALARDAAQAQQPATTAQQDAAGLVAIIENCGNCSQTHPLASPCPDEAPLDPALDAARGKSEGDLLDKLPGLDDLVDETPAADPRAREPDGTFKADDPSTPNLNEAWQDGTAPSKPKRGRKPKQEGKPA
jgi:hypothetical protein